jgi:hypothetical protein
VADARLVRAHRNFNGADVSASRDRRDGRVRPRSPLLLRDPGTKHGTAGHGKRSNRCVVCHRYIGSWSRRRVPEPVGVGTPLARDVNGHRSWCLLRVVFRLHAKGRRTHITCLQDRADALARRAVHFVDVLPSSGLAMERGNAACLDWPAASRAGGARGREARRDSCARSHE